MTLKLNSANNITRRITLIDGASIFFIVLYHELGEINSPDSLFLLRYLATFGLGLFIFSSGFKIGFNHPSEINSKSFISKYFAKRFVRLYKAYIGYTLLAFIPLYFVSYLSIHYLKLNFKGTIDFWNNLNINNLLKIMIGDNIISPQLWYLIALLVITTVCFTILYFFKINTLFYFFLPLVLFDVVYWNDLKTYLELMFNIMIYMPIYIFGIFYGYNRLDQNKLLSSYICSISFFVLFFISFIYPQSCLYKYDVLLYGLTLSPFMILFSEVLLNVRYIREPLFRFGRYSFQIYLFHWPLILPLLSRFIINILNINYFFVPYLITFFAINVCIYTYNLTKIIKLNTLFE